jgi:NADH:ubiquinone oxidoreductase subunit 6 (subunit J)
MPNTIILLGTVVVLTAIVVAAYDASTDVNADPKKRFAQVLFAGGLVAGAVVFFSQESKPKVSTTPYVLDAPAVSVPQVPGTVAMPSS